MMKCWKMNLRPGQQSWWAPTAWKIGAIVTWLWKLRRLNGPNFTWPIFMFASAIPEKLLGWMGRIYIGKPLKTKTRKELLASIKPHYLQFFRADNGDLPDDFTPPPAPELFEESLRVVS